MDTPPAISPPPASKVRPVLLRCALAAAFFLAAVLLPDCAMHHQILRLLMDSGWCLLPGFGMLLVFLLAVLLGELRDMIRPASRAWSTSEHVDFIAIFCIFGFFMLLAFYFVTMFSMLHDYGSPGE